METVAEEIYNRQKNLIKEIPDDFFAMVIGVGGIGSWVAVDLALLGVKNIVIFDPDKLEASNLNRTLFKESQIDMYKTDAIKELIEERRSDVFVLAEKEIFETDMMEKYNNINVIYDCTDNLRTKNLIKESGLQVEKYMKLGYDGFEATFSLNDFKTGAWGEESGYTVVPSFFGTPQIVSALAIVESLINDNKEPETTSFNITEIMSKFNIKKQIKENNVKKD